MGRHALAKNKLEGLGEEYVIISKPDIGALAKLINMARGGLSVENFSYKTRISTQILYDITSGKRKTNVNYIHLLSIAENANPESGVSLKMLMDANGMIQADSVKKKIASLSDRVSDINTLPNLDTPSPKRGQKRGSKKAGKTEDCTVSADSSNDPYRDFIKDLAYYAGNKEVAQIQHLHDGKDMYYADLAIKKMLAKFRCKSEADKARRIESLKEYFRTGLAKDFPDVSASEYEHVLDELLLGKDRIF